MHVGALSELKKLQRERGDASPFHSHLEFLKWAYEVAPRLAFDQKLEAAFKMARNSAESHRALNISPDESINDAIGLVNQAVIALQQKQLELARNESTKSKPTPLLLPEKMTLKWIWEHAPTQFYGYCLAGLSAAFGLGIAYSEIRENAKQISTTKNTIQPSASAPAKNTAAAPIIPSISQPPTR